jgi:YggT family protein
MFRMFVSWVSVFARDWRARGGTAAALEVVFSATDPPLRAVGRLVPPLRLGRVQLDIAFIVVFFTVLILMNVVSSL